MILSSCFQDTDGTWYCSGEDIDIHDPLQEPPIYTTGNPIGSTPGDDDGLGGDPFDVRGRPVKPKPKPKPKPDKPHRGLPGTHSCRNEDWETTDEIRLKCDINMYSDRETELWCGNEDRKMYCCTFYKDGHKVCEELETLQKEKKDLPKAPPTKERV